jgi:hypothetical protein
MAVQLATGYDRSTKIGQVEPVRSRSRWFWLSMAIVIFVAIFGGFARTYYLKSFFDTPALISILHVHGFVFTAWMLLLIVQTALVAARRTDIHRRLGVAGLVLAAIVVVVGAITVIDAEKRDLAQGESMRRSVIGVAQQFFFLFAFACGVLTGLWYRRRPEVHKRWMLFATVCLMPPGLARLARNVWPLASVVVLALLVVGIVIHDFRTRGRVHPATWGGLLLSFFVFFPVPLATVARSSETWQRFVSWLLGQL